MSGWWAHDERMMSKWWIDDERMIGGWWADDERMMSRWWADDERMMSWWWADDERMMSGWWTDFFSVLIFYWQKQVDDSKQQLNYIFSWWWVNPSQRIGLEKCVPFNQEIYPRPANILHLPRIWVKCTCVGGKSTPKCNEKDNFHKALPNVKKAYVTLRKFTPDLKIFYTDISAISVTLCNSVIGVSTCQ